MSSSRAASRNGALTRRAQVHHVAPREAFWNFRELPAFLLNDAFDAAANAVLTAKPAFVYQRYSINNYTGLRVATNAGVPLVIEYNGSEIWMSRHWGRPLAHEKLSDRIERLNVRAADLVVASYMIGEIGDAERESLAGLLWAKTRDTLLVVEPGTPAGYARIIALRAQLIADGAHVAAPCPHDGKCPLQAPDWCHFTQRLQRSRAHKQVKGAELPFEDERFAYVALTRAAVAERPSRVLAQPAVTKVEIAAKLCTPKGLTLTKVPRRAKVDYASARRWRWGDAVD